MPELVGYLLLFTGVGVAFILVNLSVGKLIRPATMNPEKATIYECGEPTIGSAWVQFDLRFYVVALLFVIFDVEMAFFFPWAVVFGQANQLAVPDLPPDQRAALVASWQQSAPKDVLKQYQDNPNLAQRSADAARSLARLAFVDILFFFGVLLVGFAYLWKRGDLDWVRGIAAQRAERPPVPREQLPMLTKD